MGVSGKGLLWWPSSERHGNLGSGPAKTSLSHPPPYQGALWHPLTRLDILSFFLFYTCLHILVLCNYVHVCVESQMCAGMHVCACECMYVHVQAQVIAQM